MKLQDKRCVMPGCAFMDPRVEKTRAGRCTGEAGILSYRELSEIVPSLQWVDSVALTRMMVFGEDEWVSFDGQDTLRLKMLKSRQLCLGGVSAWSVDQDTISTALAASLV
jgi:chitinase